MPALSNMDSDRMAKMRDRGVVGPQRPQRVQPQPAAPRVRPDQGRPEQGMQRVRPGRGGDQDMQRQRPKQGFQRPQPAEDAFQSRPAPAQPMPTPRPEPSLGGGASALGPAPQLPGLAGGGAAPLGPPPVSQVSPDFMQSRMRDPLAALGGRTAGNMMGVNPAGGGMFLRQLGLQ